MDAHAQEFRIPYSPCPVRSHKDDLGPVGSDLPENSGEVSVGRRTGVPSSILDGTHLQERVALETDIASSRQWRVDRTKVLSSLGRDFVSPADAATNRGPPGNDHSSSGLAVRDPARCCTTRKMSGRTSYLSSVMPNLVETF